MKCVNCQQATNPNDKMANFCDNCYEFKSWGLNDKEIEMIHDEFDHYQATNGNEYWDSISHNIIINLLEDNELFKHEIDGAIVKCVAKILELKQINQ